MMARAAAPALVVAGLSARALAEAAVRDGFVVWALDAFGDADTRAAALGWTSIASATQPLRLDAGRLAHALVSAREALRQRGHECLGWVAGGGVEATTAALEDGVGGVPRIGTAAAGLRAVRDPARFFETLDAWGIAHPEVRPAPPEDALGWLWKDPDGCGGTHIREARTAGTRASGYWQREVPGVPVSATLLCNGQDAVLLGVNRQWLAPSGEARWTFGGLVGAIEGPGRVATALQGVAARLAHSFGLRGWCSVDAMLAPDGQSVQVLEVNPRWPASLAVYGADGGLMKAHLQACLHGALPDAEALARWRGPRRAGVQIVYARRALALDDRARARLDARAELHDRPWAPPGERVSVPPGAPVCTVELDAALDEPVETLMTRLAEVRDSLLDTLEAAS